MPSLQYSILFLLRRSLQLEYAFNLIKSAIVDNCNIDIVLHSIVNRLHRIPIISQDQLHSKIFFPCFKEASKPEYLTKSLLLYCKELIFNEIPIELSLQMLLIKGLILSKNYCILQDLATYHIINDSKDIAMLLVDLSKKKQFPYGYLLGIDMLFRMKLYTIAMDVMISNGDMMETMMMLSNHPCPGYDLNKLHRDTNDLYTNIMIQEFIKENIY